MFVLFRVQHCHTLLEAQVYFFPSLIPYDSLTTREREVLQLTAQGYTHTEIAQRLFISPRTVETHRTNLMQKLGLQSQTDLVRFAIRKGLIQP